MNSPRNEQWVLPSRQDEEALLTTLRTRAEQAVYPNRIVWEQSARSAERDDLRTRLALSRSIVDQLPSGSPWRGRAVEGRWVPRTVMGITIGLAVPWLDLAAGSNGATTPNLAMDWYRREHARWQQQHGSIPFVAAVAGAFRDPNAISPLPDLAMLTWTGEEWQLHGGTSSEADLARLFYPQTPAQCAAQVAAQLDRSPNFPRLLSEIAGELRLPAAVAMPMNGKNLGAYALEYRSGHHLFYRR